MSNFNNLFLSGLIVGAIGDMWLQLVNETPYGNRGLVNYFEGDLFHRTGRVVQASMLTAGVSGLYQLIDSRQSPAGFLSYAGLVDVLYRLYYPVLFPDLKEYYEKNRIDMTILYNVITAGLVLAMDKLI